MMKTALLGAPSGHIDDHVRQSIAAWDDEPKAIQILHTLDMSVSSGGASDFVVTTLQALYLQALEDENTTHEQLITQATWRV